MSWRVTLKASFRSVRGENVEVRLLRNLATAPTPVETQVAFGGLNVRFGESAAALTPGIKRTTIRARLKVDAAVRQELAAVIEAGVVATRLEVWVGGSAYAWGWVDPAAIEVPMYDGPSAVELTAVDVPDEVLDRPHTLGLNAFTSLKGVANLFLQELGYGEAGTATSHGKYYVITDLEPTNPSIPSSAWNDVGFFAKAIFDQEEFDAGSASDQAPVHRRAPRTIGRSAWRSSQLARRRLATPEKTPLSWGDVIGGLLSAMALEMRQRPGGDIVFVNPRALHRYWENNNTYQLKAHRFNVWGAYLSAESYVLSRSALQLSMIEAGASFRGEEPARRFTYVFNTGQDAIVLDERDLYMPEGGLIVKHTDEPEQGKWIIYNRNPAAHPDGSTYKWMDHPTSPDLWAIRCYTNSNLVQNPPQAFDFLAIRRIAYVDGGFSKFAFVARCVYSEAVHPSTQKVLYPTIGNLPSGRADYWITSSRHAHFKVALRITTTSGDKYWYDGSIGKWRLDNTNPFVIAAEAKVDLYVRSVQIEIGGITGELDTGGQVPGGWLDFIVSRPEIEDSNSAWTFWGFFDGFRIAVGDIGESQTIALESAGGGRDVSLVTYLGEDLIGSTTPPPGTLRLTSDESTQVKGWQLKAAPAGRYTGTSFQEIVLQDVGYYLRATRFVYQTDALIGLPAASWLERTHLYDGRPVWPSRIDVDVASGEVTLYYFELSTSGGALTAPFGLLQGSASLSSGSAAVPIGAAPSLPYEASALADPLTLVLRDENGSTALNSLTLSGQLISNVTGTAPFQVSSSALVTNLNADKLDGYDASAFPRKAENATITGSWTFNTTTKVGGSLSVGTTASPSYTLDVVGTGRFTGDLRTKSILYAHQVRPTSGYWWIHPTNPNSFSVRASNMLAFRSPMKVERWNGTQWVNITSSFDWRRITSDILDVYDTGVKSSAGETVEEKLRFTYDLGNKWGAVIARVDLQHVNNAGVLIEHSDDAQSWSTYIDTGIIPDSAWDASFELPISNSGSNRYQRITVTLRTSLTTYTIKLRHLGLYFIGGLSYAPESAWVHGWDVDRNIELRSDGSTGKPALTWESDTNTGIYHPSDDTLGLVTAGAERLRISSGGDVGIGTTSPAAALHISRESGDLLYLQATGGGYGNTGSIVFKTYGSPSGANNPGAKISFIDDGSFSAHIAVLTKTPGADSNSLVERMRLTSTGNVGIGTMSPAYKLDVAGNGRFASDLTVDGTLNATGSFQLVGADLKMRRAGDGDTTWKRALVAWPDRLDINSETDFTSVRIQGYVGIRTVPSYPFDVSGQSRFHDDVIFNKTISSSSFGTGFFGDGWRITSLGEATFESLTVRGTLRVYELLLEQLRATNGNVVVTDAARLRVQSVSGSTVTLVVVQDDSDRYIPFAVGDLVLAQRFNWNTSSKSYDVVLRIKGTVSSVNNSTKPYTCTITLTSDSTVPSVNAEYDFVRVGSSDTARQGVIYLAASDQGAPFLDVIDGIASWSDWTNTQKIKLRLGKLNGITDADFGGALSGYGLYANNVYLKGRIVITGGSGIANLSDAGALATKNQANLDTDVVDGSTYKRTTSNEKTGASRAYTALDSSGHLVTAVKPGATIATPPGAGLYMDRQYMGYYSGGAWKVYIQNDGKFRFEGNASQYIAWDGTTLSVLGTVKHAGGVWELNNDGSGKIARGLIRWDSAGVVRFDGSAINPDPDCEDPNAWVISGSNQGVTAHVIDDGGKKTTVFRNANRSAVTWMNSATLIPIDPNARYCIRWRVREYPTDPSTGYVYVGVALFDENGNNIAGHTYGTGGGQWWYALSHAKVGTSWNEGYAEFGKGTGQTEFPSNARYMKALFILNYPGGSTGYHEIDYVRIERIPTYQDGQTIISGGYLNTSLIKARSIVASQLAITDFSDVKNASGGDSKISGWVLKPGRIQSLDGEIILDSSQMLIKVTGSTGYVQMHHSGSGNWGLRGVSGTSTVFELGSTNRIAGWTIGSTRLYNGTAIVLDAQNQRITVNGDGSYSSLANGIFLGMDGGTPKFRLKNKLTFDGDSLAIDGTIYATAGNIGGWSISGTQSSGQLSSGNIRLISGSNARIEIGATSPIIAGIAAGSSSSDVVFWAGNSYSSRNTAPFRVTLGGSLTATAGTIGGWTIGSSKLYNGTAIVLDAQNRRITINGDGSYDSLSNGIFLGMDGSVPKFRLKSRLMFDGDQLVVQGNIAAEQLTLSGSLDLGTNTIAANAGYFNRVYVDLSKIVLGGELPSVTSTRQNYTLTTIDARFIATSSRVQIPSAVQTLSISASTYDRISFSIYFYATDPTFISGGWLRVEFLNSTGTVLDTKIILPSSSDLKRTFEYSLPSGTTQVRFTREAGSVYPIENARTGVTATNIYHLSGALTAVQDITVTARKGMEPEKHNITWDGFSITDVFGVSKVRLAGGPWEDRGWNSAGGESTPAVLNITGGLTLSEMFRFDVAEFNLSTARQQRTNRAFVQIALVNDGGTYKLIARMINPASVNNTIIERTIATF